MPATIQTAPQASALERLDLARKELLSRNSEDGQLVEQHAIALNNGQDCEQITERRKQIAKRLYDLALMIHGPESRPELGLERQAAVEERNALIADVEAAIVKTQEDAERLRQQGERVKAADRAYLAATAEFERIKRESTGTYTARLRLDNHRKLHPEIEESDNG